MYIHHVALWTDKLEELREFYCGYFQGKSNEKYVNPAKGFESYFISFDGGATLEIMSRTDIKERFPQPCIGYCHVSFMLSGREAVMEMTECLRKDGYEITGEPRITGDGFFESVAVDPDGNLVELMAT